MHRLWVALSYTHLMHMAWHLLGWCPVHNLCTALYLSYTLTLHKYTIQAR